MGNYRRNYEHGLVVREDRVFGKVWAAVPHGYGKVPIPPLPLRFATWDDALRYATTGEVRNPVTDPWLAPQIKGALTDA